MNQEIINLLKAAVECSVFLSPTEPGLSYQEILEVGKRAGFQDGEVGDAAPYAGERSLGRLIPGRTTRQMWVFLSHEEPEYRNFAAFDFVFSELNARVRADGVENARVERDFVVERAMASGIPRNDIELAITYQVFSEQLTEKDGVSAFLAQRRGSPTS